MLGTMGRSRDDSVSGGAVVMGSGGAGGRRRGWWGGRMAVGGSWVRTGVAGGGWWVQWGGRGGGGVGSDHTAGVGEEERVLGTMGWSRGRQSVSGGAVVMGVAVSVGRHAYLIKRYQLTPPP